MLLDLSHSIEAEMPVYPGTEPTAIEKICSLRVNGFRERQIKLSTHTGTHIDSPSHIFKNGKTLDNYPLETFYGTAVVINCENNAKITVADINKGINYQGPLDFVLLYTGWDKLWGNSAYFLGFPILDKKAAEFLSKLPIKGIGIDASSFDAMDDQFLINHNILLAKDIILVENLCGMKPLINKKIIFSCMPLKIKQADGSPVRAYALVY